MTAPVGGALYRHPKFRGLWRVEAAGPKWVTLRSLTVPTRGGGYWATHREPRAGWPNGWERAS